MPTHRLLPVAPLIRRVWGMNPNFCCCELCCGEIESFNASFSYQETSGLSNITISASGSLTQAGFALREAEEVAGNLCLVGSTDGEVWSIGTGSWSNEDAGTHGLVSARIAWWEALLDCSGCGVVDVDFVVSVSDDGAVIDSRTISFSLFGGCIDQDFSENRSRPKPGGGTITEAVVFRLNSGAGWQVP